jgi:hypothetical protein
MLDLIASLLHIYRKVFLRILIHRFEGFLLLEECVLHGKRTGHIAGPQSTGLVCGTSITAKSSISSIIFAGIHSLLEKRRLTNLVPFDCSAQ